MSARDRVNGLSAELGDGMWVVGAGNLFEESSWEGNHLRGHRDK